MYTLKITRPLSTEWTLRRIERFIPALQDYSVEARQIMVDADLLQAIEDDSAFMADPRMVDLTAAERRVYRALVAQCRRVRAIGPIEVISDPDAEMIDNFSWTGSRHHY